MADKVDASYAYVLVTTKSASDAIDDNLTEIFDTDLDSIAFSSNISDDITWNQSAGTFTFVNGGVYHIILTAITSQETSNRLQTTAFNLNSAAAFYTGESFVGAAGSANYDPVETTHQKVILIAAGDVLHIKTQTAGGGVNHDMGIEKGTSLIITKITSGVFSSATVTTNGSGTDEDEHNPYDTNLSGGPVISALSSGITWTGTEGSMTVPSDGKYLIMITNFHAETQGGDNTNIDVTIKLKSNSDILYTGSTRVNHTDDPTESTICVVEDLDADDVLTVTWNIGGTGNNVFACKGSTITVYKLLEGSSCHTVPTKRGQDLYISVVNKATMTPTAAEVNPFQDSAAADNYSSPNFDTRTTNGITYAMASGTFTVSEPGFYFVMWNPIFQATNDAIVTMKILINGVAKVTADTPQVDSYPDPLNRSLSAFLRLGEYDAITVTMDSDSPTVGHNAGSHMTIFRYYPFLSNDSVADGLINNDFTIDTFSQGNLSAQYERNIAQVPFKLGIRGAGTLRGRCARPSVVKLGDKKN